MRPNPKLSIVVSILLLSGFACFRPLFAQTSNSDELSTIKGTGSRPPFIVGCSPDSPIVSSRETIAVRAWATTATGQRLKYTWSVTGGRVEGGGPEARWDFSGVRPGIYEATVQVREPTAGSVDCSLRVVVRSGSIIAKSAKRETGRTFLVLDQAEATGYGLYSYLLFGSPPGDNSRERYLKAIEEYLKFPDLKKLEKRISRTELNITYLPLEVPAEPKVLKELAAGRYDSAAKWILDHYDYARARTLLRNLPGTHRNGPYIISFLKPYDWNVDLSRPYLYQDQSSVPPHLVSLWMKEFLNQAAQERFWETETGAQVALKLRTAIGIMAVGLPKVRDALDEWIAWVG